MIKAASICLWISGIGFGIPGLYGIWHLQKTQTIASFMGFPTYGKGPFERIGIYTSIPLLAGFLLVYALECISGWGKETPGVHRGVSAYFCHNTYVAQVLDMTMVNGMPVIPRVCCAVDCGIVVNPDAAANMAEGAIVDGIGNALYGGITFNEGKPDQDNLDTYRLIRHGESPRSVDVHFVKNEIDPTGMGEPAFPPVFAAVANALYRSTGKRYYHQPFLQDI